MSGNINFGEPALKRIRLVKNLYYEDHEIKKRNPFRAAESRLERNIFVSRESKENEENMIPNPVDECDQAFGNYIDLLGILCEKKIVNPTPMQSQAWPVILRGDDMIGIGSTETDQRLAFLLPGLVHIQYLPETVSDCQWPIMVCLSPTPESASQIKETITKFKHPIINCARVQDFDGGKPKNRYEIISATPAELKNLIQDDVVTLASVSYIVLEKADEMLDKKFDSTIKDILRCIPDPHQTIITSTTWSESVRQLASLYCDNPVKVVVCSLDLSKVLGITQKYEVIRQETDKLERAIEYLRVVASNEKVVVFCNNESAVNDISSKLKIKNLKCDRLLVDTEKLVREKSLDSLKTGDIQMLITNVAACDLDMTGITSVFNYDMPLTIEEYVDRFSRIYVDGRKVMVMSLLSDNDWAIVPDFIALLNKMKQVVLPILYDLANQFKQPTYSEGSNFDEIIECDCFVDKTLLLKAVLDAPEYMMLTAPSKFGKSTNLNMMRHFFDVAKKKSEIFKNLKISRHEEIMRKHHHNYAILWVDMSQFTGRIDSREACLTALRSIIHSAYKEYDFLCYGLSKEEDRATCSEWTDKDKYQEISEYQIFTALEKLVSFLHEYYKKDIIILCDEFDALCTNALSTKVDVATLDEIIQAYFNIFMPLFKDFSENVFKAVFTGITYITCYRQTLPYTMPPFSVLENTRFSRYYGILKCEFDELLEKSVFEKLRSERTKAISYYNGYHRSESCDILCTYSVIRYLSKVLETPKIRLRPYWHRSDSAKRCEDVWQRKNMRSLLQKLIQNVSTFAVRNLYSISSKDFLTIREICDTENYSTNDMDALFTYFQQLGYFTIVPHNGYHLKLRIPNEELRRTFCDILVKSIQFEVKADYESITDCGKYFNELMETNCDRNATFERIKEGLKIVLEKCTTVLDESTVEHLIFGVLVASMFYPSSHNPVKKHRMNERRCLKKFDLCFYRENFGLLVKLKFGEIKSASSALGQIKTNKYFEVLDKKLPAEIFRKLYIRIHVNEKRLVDILFTDDIKNI